MSDKDIFMKVAEFGELYIYDVLLFYIYPRVFVCQDQYECKYLFYEMDSEDDDIDIWLVSKITKKEYYNLIDRDLFIQKVYNRKNKFDIFSISKYYNENDKIELKYDGKDWISHLPVNPVYSEKELIDETIEVETLNVARTTGCTTFDVRLFPGSDRHSIPHNILSNLCNSLTALTGSIFNEKRSQPLRISTAPGSCIVRFSFPDQINLFNESNASKEMGVLNKIFTCDDLTECLDSVSNKNQFIKSYSAFFDSIRKTHGDVQFSTASPSSNTVCKINLSKEKVQRNYRDGNSLCKVETIENHLRGTLIALDTKTNKFKFSSTDEKEISGIINPSLLKGESFEVPAYYDATIKINRYLYKDGEKNREIFTLVNLENI